MKFLFSAGIVLFRIKNNIREYLLLHYLSGHWDFAKGKIEEGETKHEAALRELKEETDIAAKIIDSFEEQLFYFFKEKGDLIKKTVYFFVGEAEAGAITLSREHQGFEWVPYKEALEKLTFKNAQKVLEKAEKFLIQ